MTDRNPLMTETKDSSDPLKTPDILTYLKVHALSPLNPRNQIKK